MLIVISIVRTWSVIDYSCTLRSYPRYCSCAAVLYPCPCVSCCHVPCPSPHLIVIVFPLHNNDNSLLIINTTSIYRASTIYLPVSVLPLFFLSAGYVVWYLVYTRYQVCMYSYAYAIVNCHTSRVVVTSTYASSRHHPSVRFMAPGSSSSLRMMRDAPAAAHTRFLRSPSPRTNCSRSNYY